MYIYTSMLKKIILLKKKPQQYIIIRKQVLNLEENCAEKQLDIPNEQNDVVNQRFQTCISLWYFHSFVAHTWRQKFRVFQVRLPLYSPWHILTSVAGSFPVASFYASIKTKPDFAQTTPLAKRFRDGPQTSTKLIWAEFHNQ